MFSKLDFRPSPPLDGATAVRRTFQSQPSSPATRFENKHIYIHLKKHLELELGLGIQKREGLHFTSTTIIYTIEHVHRNFYIFFSFFRILYQDYILRSSRWTLMPSTYAGKFQLHMSRIVVKRQGYSWKIHEDFCVEFRILRRFRIARACGFD